MVWAKRETIEMVCKSRSDLWYTLRQEMSERVRLPGIEVPGHYGTNHGKSARDRSSMSERRAKVERKKTSGII